jgi:hypothetical protein
VLIITISISGGFLGIPAGSEKDDPMVGLIIVVISIIIYSIALYQISKMEKHSSLV